MKRILILLCLPVFLWSNNLSAQCFVSTTDVSCYGACDGSLTIIANTGTSPYEYRVNGGTWSPMVGGSITLFSLCPLVYNIDIRDFFSITQSCIGTITDPPALMCNLTFIPASDSITCDGSMNVMILGGTPPYTFGQCLEDVAGVLWEVVFVLEIVAV
jgi:hypothetical protein